MTASPSNLASSLEAVARGDSVACAQLSNEIYQQLRIIARSRLGARPRTSLDTTVLVHEAYLKMAAMPDAEQSRQRATFFALAAKTMRNLLIDYLRERHALKRGGEQVLLTLEPGREPGIDNNLVDVLAIEQGLQALSELDPRLVAVVECRFFAGMDYDEIALAQGTSERTVRRDWRRARAFLRAHLEDGAGPIMGTSDDPA